MDDKLTKKQRQQARQELVRAQLAKQHRRDRRTKVLARTGVTLLVLAVFWGIGLAVWDANRPVDQSGPANMISGGAVFTGVDGKPKIVETPAMAQGAKATPTDPKSLDAPARIVSYLDFGCEYCKAFETGNAQQIEEMVAAGDASLEVQPVAITGPYAVRAGSAVSCLVAYQPESFFPMLKTMYENQPGEGGTLTNQEILDLWSGAGIDASDKLAQCVQDERYSDWIQTRTQTITSDPKVANPATGGFGTPTIFVNEQRYAPQDLTSATEFKAFVDKATSSTDSSTDGSTDTGGGKGNGAGSKGSGSGSGS